MAEGPEASGEGAARERKAFPLRLSADLHEELRRWATQDLRSLNAHIEFLLREAVRRRRGQAAAQNADGEGG
jgi:hypothetical protein